MPTNFQQKSGSPGSAVYFNDHLKQRAENRGALGDFSGAVPKAAAPANYPASRPPEAVELRQSRQRSTENNESTIFPYIPRKRQERIGLLIDYLYLPASQEAGDQVDFLILGENRVGILLADVHGKIPDDSTPVLKTVLRSNSTGLSAAATLRYLEQYLIDSGGKGFSLTAFYAIFDQNKRLLHFASAGHLPMMVYRPALGQIFLLNTPGSPFGETGSALVNGNRLPAPTKRRIESEKAALQQNDLFVLYSDGLLSLRGTSGEYFGRQRLVEFIARHGDADPTTFLIELRKLLEKFTGGKHTHQDDITVIVLKNVLRNLDKLHAEAANSDLASQFLSTEQEHAILTVLRTDPQASVDEIIAELQQSDPHGMTPEQVKSYIEQNGRWLQPWPAREPKGGPRANGQPLVIDHQTVAEAATRRLQEELIAAFPIRNLLAKRYNFSSKNVLMQKALQFYNNGDYLQALEEFSRLRHKIKKSAAVHCFFGNLYLLLNRPAQAQQEFFAALNYDQTSSHALAALSYLALREGEFNMAIESLATALRLGACEQEYQNFLNKLILAVENREDRNDWLT
jgi:hypothetical protein